MPRINANDAEHYQSGVNGEWFGLKNHGDIARVQFMIDSYEDLDVFACHKVKVGDFERYVDCLRTYDQPIDDCPFCAEGIAVKPVRIVVMYQHEDGKVKIWERGKNFMAKLQGLCNRYSPLSDYVFEIERNGKAGDKETKYEIYPLDKVEPFDLSGVERPELLGGLILQKTPEEMEVFLDTGNFPDSDNNEAPERRQPASGSHRSQRRAPAGRQAAPAGRQSAPAASEPPRRRSPQSTPAANTQAAPPRGPSRGRRSPASTDTEVF